MMRPFFYIYATIEFYLVMNTLKFESFQDYVLFLYVHIAFSDGVVQLEEKDLILEKLSKYFKNKEEALLKFEAMVEIYQENSFNVEAVIKESHANFNHIEYYKKYKVFKDLYDIIKADGVIEKSETQAIEKLKSIIDQSVSID